MKREHVDKLIDDATHHTCHSANTIESAKLIRRLLSVVCYQHAQIDMFEEAQKPKGVFHSGPR